MIPAFVDNSVAQELLFETFLHLIGIFGSVQPRSPVHYNISNIAIFQAAQLYCAAGGGEETRVPTEFIVGNLNYKNFYLKLFLHIRGYTLCVRARVRVDAMCQERTLCMYSPCQERTHLMSAVGFGIRFGLVILKNPVIGHKIMAEA